MRRKGFTLIELMMVVVIIGIVASFAIPSYQNYVIRTRVTEGLTLSTGAKLAVSEFLMSHNGQATNEIGSGFQGPAPTENVASIIIEKGTGNVIITLTPIAGDGTLILHPKWHAGQISWTCKGGTLPEKFRPSNC